MRFELSNTLGIILSNTGFSPDYFWYIYLPVAIWLMLVIILIAVLMKKYTFGKDKNPYESETFGLPRGFMRGILTLSLLFIVILFETYNLQSDSPDEGKFQEFVVAFQMMIAFYFGSKVAHHVSSTERHKALFKKEVAMGEQTSVTRQASEEVVTEEPVTQDPPTEKETPSVEQMENKENEDGTVG